MRQQRHKLLVSCGSLPGGLGARRHLGVTHLRGIARLRLLPHWPWLGALAAEAGCLRGPASPLPASPLRSGSRRRPRRCCGCGTSTGGTRGLCAAGLELGLGEGIQALHVWAAWCR